MKIIYFTSLIIITLIVLSFSSPIYAYKVEAYNWTTKNYMFYINPIGVDDSVDYSGKSSTIISAINNWDAVNTSNFTSTSAGATSETGWGVNDGNNVVTWRGPSQFSGSVIGMASVWYSGSNILDADIKLNTSFVNDSRMPLLVMHESGHAIGIGHTKEQGESATTEEDRAVMHWELDSQTAPNCQDYCAVTALYPKSASCRPNDTPGTYHNCLSCCDGTNTAPTAEISSVSPNPASVEQTITVEATGSDEYGDKVQLKIDWDDGEVSSYSSLQTSDSTFTFTHTYSTSGTFDIRVKPKDSNGKEGKWSDPASLTVNVPSISPTVTITSPNGGESWLVGSSKTISWTTTGTVSNIKIQYSTNNGGSWATIISSTPNNGSYSWTVPNTSSTQCLIEISDASDGYPTDTSDVVFSIYSPISTEITLNRDQLNYGSTISGFHTGDQAISISNNRGGALNWTVTDNQSWLSCTPSSGTGSGIITVSLDPSGLSVGTYPGTITVSDPNASNSPQTVDITLKVYGSGGTSEPFGEFATPIHNSTVRSSLPVTGWVLDDIGVESVKIYRSDGKNHVYIGDAIFVEGARPDVEQAYPGYPMNYQAGWGYMMLTNFLPNGGNGTFTFHAIATDIEGNQVALGAKTITCDNANAVKPFGAIDTPTQGGTSTGSDYVNWGWVLTPLPNNIPTDGSTINVYVNSVNIGNPTYNIYRADIANFFPSYANSGGAIGYFYFDTTVYANGVHTIQWTATDNASNTDGIGSRYFTIQNTSSVNTNKAKSRAVSHSMHQVMKLPIDYSVPIKVKPGFNENIESRIITSDEKGISRIVLRELERIEIQLSDGASNIYGYIVSGSQLRPSPIGSTIDARTGKFLWQPGPGFVGEYRFIFIVKDNCGNLTRKNLIVNIIPKF